MNAYFVIQQSGLFGGYSPCLNTENHRYTENTTEATLINDKQLQGTGITYENTYPPKNKRIGHLQPHGIIGGWLGGSRKYNENRIRSHWGGVRGYRG
eukprot:3370516-Amphidinium_carterae.1